MLRRLLTRRLPGLLWALTLCTSAALLAGVALAPLLIRAVDAEHGWGQVVALFARDALVRRTALASAIGLVVTACVFFRPPRLTLRPKAERPSGSDVIGA